MRLSATARRERILSSAQSLFARQGYRGTTTREIAARAGITEAMVFRHFRSKEDLYWAVLTHICESRRGPEKMGAILDQAGADDKVFAAMAEDILRRNLRDSSMTRLLLFSGLENHKLSHRFFRRYISDFYGVLAERIEQRIRKGEFRRLDPMLAARGFLGMVTYHILVQDLFGGGRGKGDDVAEVSRTLTEIWLAGMRNPTRAARNGSRNGKNGHKNGNHQVRKKS